MPQYVPLTLIAPIKPSHKQQLIAFTGQLRNHQLSGGSLPFESLNKIHYSRVVILDEINRNGTVIPQRLVVAFDHDDSVEDFLTQLCSACSEYVDDLFQHCEGYPENRTPASRKDYLLKCRVKPIAAFAGAKTTMLQQIRQEEQLHNHVWEYLRTNKWEGRSAKDIFDSLKQYVSADQQFDWTKYPVKIPKIQWLPIILVLLLLLPLILLIVVFVAFWILYIHFFHEKKDVPLGIKPSQVSEEHIQSLELYEDYYNQNQFTQLLFMKPGKARLYTLTSFFPVSKMAYPLHFVGYKLMDIPTIHFASWMMLDNNKTMLFFSNFDGSWQQYLGDFIDKSGWGLTGIWSNTDKFPKTKFLFWDGAYDEEHFLAWSRTYQIPTQLWYCAYPHLSIKNINNNTWLRHQLHKNLSEAEAKAFLQRI